MKRIASLAILCLAFGAVRAEAQVQVVPASLSLSPVPVALGGDVSCRVELPATFSRADLVIAVGLAAGASPVSVGGQWLYVPLDAAVVVLATRTASAHWSGSFRLPPDPEFLGLTLHAAAAAAGANGLLCVSPLVPFGPIIEDSIQ